MMRTTTMMIRMIIGRMMLTMIRRRMMTLTTSCSDCTAFTLSSATDFSRASA